MRKQEELTVMNSHAVLLPAVALVDSAGVGVGLLVSHGGPGQTAQVWGHQADVAPPAVLCGHVDDGVGVGGANQTAVLAIFTVGARNQIRGQELAVHPDITFKIRQTCKHLGPLWREQICVH